MAKLAEVFLGLGKSCVFQGLITDFAVPLRFVKSWVGIIDYRR
jgi:hypothetical protein